MIAKTNNAELIEKEANTDALKALFKRIVVKDSRLCDKSQEEGTYDVSVELIRKKDGRTPWRCIRLGEGLSLYQAIAVARAVKTYCIESHRTIEISEHLPKNNRGNKQ